MALVMPVPLKLIDTVGLSGSLLVMVMVPDLAPTTVGLNATMKLKLPPGLRVIGSDGNPLSGKEVAFELAMLVMASGQEPVLLTVTGCGALCVLIH
jgi:hypothetical protein